MPNATEYARRKKAGQCMDCKAPAMPGFLRCRKHQASQETRHIRYEQRNHAVRLKVWTDRKQQRIDSGLCVSCGAQLCQDADAGMISCVNCRSKLGPTIYKPITYGVFNENSKA